MTSQFVNIHTHRPTGRGIELRTAGIHPWDADKEDIAALGTLPADVQAIGETVRIDKVIRPVYNFKAGR